MHEISLTRTGTKVEFSKSQDSTENTTKSISTRLFFFLFVCFFFKTCQNFNNRRFSLLLRVIPTEQSCYDFETERWSPVAEIPTGKARYPLLSISFLIAQSPFIFVFQIFALEYLLLMDVCMQFVDQMEFVA